MARRYVPKTYNNRRFLRFIAGGIITLALTIVIVFLVLFFVLQRYVVEGQLQIPLLMEDNTPLPQEQDIIGDLLNPDTSTEPEEEAPAE